MGWTVEVEDEGDDTHEVVLVYGWEGSGSGDVDRWTSA
jgi:hypothetical protein